MTLASGWLGSRRPPPPPELAKALVVEAGSEGELASALTKASRARLDEALAVPGRVVRPSAFRLLEADALATYACEAALESDQPEAALRRIQAAMAD